MALWARLVFGSVRGQGQFGRLDRGPPCTACTVGRTEPVMKQAGWGEGPGRGY